MLQTAIPDSEALAAIDRTGHLSIMERGTLYPSLRPRHATLEAIKRLCQARVLRAETFLDANGVTWAWVQRSERFMLPGWAKTRGTMLWEDLP